MYVYGGSELCPPAVTTDTKYLQKVGGKVSAQKYGRSTKKSADRPKGVPTGQHLWPMARKQGRWHHALAEGLRGWPTSHPLPSEAKPQVLGPQPSTKQTS